MRSLTHGELIRGNRNFRNLFAEQFISELGNRFNSIAGLVRVVSDASPTAAGATLIDVRENIEFEAGHAAGAKHMGRGIIERDIAQTFPDKSTELILYCGGGYRSALAVDNLQKMGYTNGWSMDDGWAAWKEAGAPTEVPIPY